MIKKFSSHRTLCFQKFCRKEKVAQSQTDILLGCTSRQLSVVTGCPEDAQSPFSEVFRIWSDLIADPALGRNLDTQPPRHQCNRGLQLAPECYQFLVWRQCEGSPLSRKGKTVKVRSDVGYCLNSPEGEWMLQRNERLEFLLSSL
ncbi:probable G-protein coupled receptor 146 isoform X3 [Phalacrocorax carbo]|uniref:probable G-protein coupled receptor 146 isoform X3 n=1 Tax=Phalacrocorax carbo TaxID=9209 RepID=UPI00311952B6